jgi:hypothetical protein
MTCTSIHIVVVLCRLDYFTGNGFKKDALQSQKLDALGDALACTSSLNRTNPSELNIEPTMPTTTNVSSTLGNATSNTIQSVTSSYAPRATARVQASPIPEWLHWLGELGIGLPMLLSSQWSLSKQVRMSFKVCSWSLNWGRVVLQNVTIVGDFTDALELTIQGGAPRYETGQCTS